MQEYTFKIQAAAVGVGNTQLSRNMLAGEQRYRSGLSQKVKRA
jgi:hypothetical protein